MADMTSGRLDQRRAFAPRVLRRYLIREFLGLLAPILLGFVLLYVVIDLFERLDTILKNEATLSATFRYFAFKTPLMVTQVLPPAVVISTLMVYGVASRRNEIIALRAGGVSLLQSAAPVLAVAMIVSLIALLWNETVVPYSTRHYQEINLLEIKKRDRRSLLSDHEIWYHGELGFYNIGHADVRRRALLGVMIYQTDPEFSLVRLVRIPVLLWDGSSWRGQEATEHVAVSGKPPETRRLRDNEIVLPERFDDFLEVQQEPEELGYSALRERIDQLRRKGIDASELEVDLHLKAAIPLSSLVLAWIAIPIAGRVRRHASIAAIVGIGALVGFGYWVALGFSSSLGQGGVLPALVAAWSANAIYSILGTILFLHGE